MDNWVALGSLPAPRPAAPPSPAAAPSSGPPRAAAALSPPTKEPFFRRLINWAIGTSSAKGRR